MAESLVITEPLVRHLLETVDAGLVHGLGKPIPGQMCVEAAISFALGEPHGDGPSCVEPAVRAGKIRLNDARGWSSNQARAKGLRSVAIAQLGSLGVVDPKRYVTRLAELTIRQIVPIAVRAAAKRNPKHGEALLAAALRCEQEGTRESCIAARDVARNARDAAAAAYAASADAAAAAAAYAADAAAAAAAYAAAAYAASADAAADAAAYAAAYADAAAAAAAYAAAAAAERDRVLSLMADLMVQALRECGSPGCDWLWLVEETA